MLLDRLVNRISSERKFRKNAGTSKLEYSGDPLGDVLRTSWGHPESTSQERPLNVRLARPQDVTLVRPQDVRSRRPRDSQIGSLGNVLGTWEGDVLRTNICRLGSGSLFKDTKMQ